MFERTKTVGQNATGPGAYSRRARVKLGVEMV
jgi:hypothetical protein